jgi:hypothetical protein
MFEVVGPTRCRGRRPKSASRLQPDFLPAQLTSEDYPKPGGHQEDVPRQAVLSAGWRLYISISPSVDAPRPALLVFAAVMIDVAFWHDCRDACNPVAIGW